MVTPRVDEISTQDPLFSPLIKRFIIPLLTQTGSLFFLFLFLPEQCLFSLLSSPNFALLLSVTFSLTSIRDLRSNNWNWQTVRRQFLFLLSVRLCVSVSLLGCALIFTPNYSSLLSVIRWTNFNPRVLHEFQVVFAWLVILVWSLSAPSFCPSIRGMNNTSSSSLIGQFQVV